MRIKLFLGIFVGMLSLPSQAGTFDSLIKEIKSKDVSISTVAALVELERSTKGIGYGLCVAEGTPHSLCNINGSLGYGLCVASGTPHSLCDVSGTVGYGLCVVSGTPLSLCKKSGSLGYGMCVASGTSHSLCATNN